MVRNIILSGGIYHPFGETSAALAGLLAPLGVNSCISEDVADVVGALEHADMLCVNALRWTMTQNDKYQPFRARWAMSLDPAAQAAIGDFVRRGGALFGLHTASICFDTWPQWADVLGGGWTWGHSFHPPPARLQVTAGAYSFKVTDELYHHLSPRPDVQILATAVAAQPADDDCAAQPVAWVRAHGAGRVFYNALGHDAASLAVPGHARLITQGARWLLNREEAAT